MCVNWRIISMKKFSEELSNWRTENNLTQTEAAKYLGLGLRTLQSYEWGDRIPPGNKSKYFIRKMADYSVGENSHTHNEGSAVISKKKQIAYDIPSDPPIAQEPTAIYRENELLKDIIKAKDELIAILREQLNNLKS